MTHAEPLVALAKASPDAEEEEILVLSPAVGILQGLPAEQDELAAGRPFARLRILDAAHPLLPPAGISGVVTRVEAPGTGRDAVPVEFGQPILVVAPAGGSRPRVARAAAKSVAGHGGGLAAGSHAVLCPADGVFYRRPRPADPPYVEIGRGVRAGQTLALIEAMKSFSAITYGGPGLPEAARVTEIRAEDAAEVRHGQILFVVEAE